LLSTGINNTHPDLASRVCTETSHDFFEIRVGNFIFTPGDPFNDCHRHGTRIAGIIAGRTTGVAPNAQLVSLKVANENNTYNQPFRIIHGISLATNLWNTENRIHILSLSATPHRNDTGVRDAIRLFPGLFVGSAGNDDRNVDNSYRLINNERIDSKIVVGATQLTGQNEQRWIGRDNSSNFGIRSVCVFAPGATIRTTRHDNNQFVDVYGTSHAVPHVVGTAALMISANPALAYHPATIRNIIKDTADRMAVLEHLSISGGRLNAHAAVTKAFQANVFTINSNNILTNFTPLTNFNGIVNIPYGVVEIATNAFSEAIASITTIHIPSTVTMVRSLAFANATSLSRVYLYRTMADGGATSFGMQVFHNTHPNLRMFVPVCTFDVFRNRFVVSPQNLFAKQTNNFSFYPQLLIDGVPVEEGFVASNINSSIHIRLANADFSGGGHIYVSIGTGEWIWLVVGTSLTLYEGFYFYCFECLFDCLGHDFWSGTPIRFRISGSGTSGIFDFIRTILLV